MGTSSTSTQKSEPSDFIKPYLSEALGGAQAQYQAGAPKYYEGSTVPTDTLNRISNYGLTSQANRAGQMAGSNYAMSQFAGGGLGDWGTVDQMRNLGAGNSYINDPATSRLADMSINGSGLGASAAGRVGDLASTGGNVAAYSRGAIGDITQAGAGSNSQIRNDIYDLITGQAQGLNPSMIPLMDTAGGGYLNANPYLDQAFSKAADNVTRQYQTGTAPAIDSAFSRSSGALRSGAAMNARDQAQENYGKTLSGLATDIYGANYAQERQNQLSAANSLGSQYLQGLGLRANTAASSADQANRDAQLRLAATGQVSGDMSGDLARRLQANQYITGAEGQDAANKLSANQLLSSTYNAGADRQLSSLNSANNAYNASRAQQLQALGMQPGYLQQQQQMDYNDLNAALGAQQQGINADIARWDYNQNAPRNNVNWYMNAINGVPSGQTSSITQQGGMGGLGAGLSGASSTAMLMKMLGLF